MVYSAIYSPTSPVDGQDDFFSPTARRFEQFSCPDCNAPLRHGACRSFSAGRVFPFGNRYPIDPLSPQENDLVDGYPPLCSVCHWTHLTNGAFRARAYTLLNPLSLRTSRAALLSVCFDETMFERCNRHLINDFQQFTTTDAIIRTGMRDVILDLTEATISMFASRFSDCGHQAHLGCI